MPRLHPFCPEVPISAKVAFLSSPAAYAGRPAEIKVIETHMSWVFLAGGFAYKLKKPVRHEFLDFSTVEARRVNCEREVKLNRRLAGDVYRGVVPLVMLAGGRLQLDGEADVVDWLVKMRRLPMLLMLNVAMEAKSGCIEGLSSLAAVLIKFYRHAAPVAISAADYRLRYADGMDAIRRELGMPYGALNIQQVDRIMQSARDFIATNGELLERRAREGRIVDAHGDLRPEHVCLEREPVIIDCLEFNRDLRLLDPIDELAYFSMECERLGGTAVGDYILQEYCDATGDRPPPALVLFYKKFRACLRAKLAIWHLADDGIQDKDKWRRRAGDYLRLAAAYSCNS